jgi:hypothetical protein
VFTRRLEKISYPFSAYLQPLSKTNPTQSSTQAITPHSSEAPPRLSRLIFVLRSDLPGSDGIRKCSAILSRLLTLTNPSDHIHFSPLCINPPPKNLRFFPYKVLWLHLPKMYIILDVIRSKLHSYALKPWARKKGYIISSTNKTTLTHQSPSSAQ